jgi:phosphoribosylglycinamide formyltransferase 1
MTSEKTPKKQIAVLLSGGGSNFGAIQAAIKSGDIDAEIVAVFSNRPNAGGLDRARALGIAAIGLDHKTFSDRDAFDATLSEALDAVSPDLIVCAGFMRVLGPAFIARWEGKIINIHPAILPLFKGLNTHARAIEAGMAVHGCTVHWVNAGVDEGAIIGQAVVPILPGDTPDSLAARVLIMEHKLYPACVADVVAGIATLHNATALRGGVPGALSMFWDDDSV